MQNLNYSLILGAGGVIGSVLTAIGFLIKTRLDFGSQKNHLNCFYAEYFVKVKAERIIKALDSLTALVDSTHQYNGTFEKALLSFRGSFIELYKIVDDKTYDSFSKYYNELLETAKNPKERNQKELDEKLKDCYGKLGKYIPNDYLFKK